MNVLEKILEEIESLHTKILRDKFAKQVTEQEIDALVKAKQIVRSHMDVGKDINIPTNGWIPVEEQSTAYDVDKVVEQIKNIGTAYCSSVGCDNECLNCDHGVIMRAIIDIVRKGGIEK